MSCDNCNSIRIVSVVAKCSDMCHASFGNTEHEGYAPQEIGISDSEDYLQFSYCLDCGKIQGNFPIEEDPEFEQVLNCCENEFDD